MAVDLTHQRSTAESWIASLQLTRIILSPTIWLLSPRTKDTIAPLVEVSAGIPIQFCNPGTDLRTNSPGDQVVR